MGPGQSLDRLPLVAKDNELIGICIKGPALAIGHFQSEMAPQILDLVTKLVLADQAYIDRLKRHYQMFKASLPSPAQHSRRPSRKQGKVKL